MMFTPSLADKSNHCSMLNHRIGSLLALCGVLAGCGPRDTTPHPPQSTKPQPATAHPTASSDIAAIAALATSTLSRTDRVQATADTGPAIDASPHHACSYLSSSEMASLLGAPIGKTSEENADDVSTCAYPPGEPGSNAQAEIQIQSNGEVDELATQLFQAFGGTEAGNSVAHPVSLGDGATYASDGVLTIKVGKRVVTVTLPMREDSEPKAMAIGTLVLKRMQTPLPQGLTADAECPPATGAPIAADSALIPLKVGLTYSDIWDTASDPGHDTECLTQVTSLNDRYVEVTDSCPSDNKGKGSITQRRICRSDMRDSHFYLTQVGAFTPMIMAGALEFSLSTDSFRELKSTGKTQHRYIDLSTRWRTASRPLKTDYDGVLALVSQNRDAFKVLVNDRLVELPAIHAEVRQPELITAAILDDERFPLVLDYQQPNGHFVLHITKISFPIEGQLEKQLTVDKRVDVYGIYFDFASDKLRPESTPVLAEIAGVMAKNSDWKLSIDGHTDNVGGDAANLVLSRKRSAAVKSALVNNFAIAPERLVTGGFGASQPQATNDTIEGRARNRRVVLMRL